MTQLQNRASTKTGILFSAMLVIFLVLTYLQMCIASLYDNYQPGIETFKLLFSPLWLLWLMFFLLLLRAKQQRLLAFARLFYRAEFLATIVMLVVFFIVDSLPVIYFTRHTSWSVPEERELCKTLIIALTSADFSNRSIVVLVKNFIVLLALAMMVEWRYYLKKTVKQC